MFSRGSLRSFAPRKNRTDATSLGRRRTVEMKRAAPICVGCVGGAPARGGWAVLEPQIERTVVERRARRKGLANHPFALAGTRHLERSMMEIGIVTRLSKEHEGRPGAAGAAFVGVVARATVPPQIVDRSIAR